MLEIECLADIVVVWERNVEEIPILVVDRGRVHGHLVRRVARVTRIIGNHQANRVEPRGSVGVAPERARRWSGRGPVAPIPLIGRDVVVRVRRAGRIDVDTHEAPGHVEGGCGESRRQLARKGDRSRDGWGEDVPDRDDDGSALLNGNIGEGLVPEVRWSERCIGG